jgi:plasmid replication initiation protein
MKNKLNIMGPGYEMSSLEKNIVYMLVAQLKESDPSDKMYSISIQALKQKLKELGQEIDLKHIEEATEKLLARVYSIEEDSSNFFLVKLVSSVTYSAGSDLIEIEIPKTIRPYLFDLKYDFTNL